MYILILPAMGIVSEILPTFSKKPLFGYPAIVPGGRHHRVHGLDGLEPPHVYGGSWSNPDYGVHDNDYGDCGAHGV